MTGTAHAEAEDPERLFNAGLNAMMQGEYKIGCALIRRSLDLDPTPGTIFTLAECYARSGRTASAVEMYDEFLTLYSQLPPGEKEQQQPRADISKQERSKLIKVVPWLTVVLPDAAPSGVTVTIDDKPFPQNLIGVATAVDPGAHRLTARAPGSRITETLVELAPEQRRSVVLNVVLESDEVPPPDGSELDFPADEGPEDRKSSGHSPLFYVAGGLGIAGLTTAVVTGVMLLDKRDTIMGDCDRVEGNWVCNSQEGIDALQTAQDVLAPVTTVALGVGVGGLALATIFWLTEPADSDRAPTSVRVRPTFAVGPGSQSVGLMGRF